ncbi:hypothetical protein [Paracraurococcus lichenis]|uniref:Uncharacterized protein n=1 Tax=Paracraurococcus lichenis TaxID=3064888 RepID=A0ABT9E9D7_9PROT|nr:hypothetical protein [Paracraurococcus sp. LOR1-02]MDO9712803.1 hypothetical protein [Paracraurococcus sp. LOR1-02]
MTATEAERPPSDVAGEPESFDLRAVMRAGLGKRPVRQVPLPPMPSVRAGEPLVLPREPEVPPLADLTGRRKLLIVCGPQNAGKTLDMRMLASELREAGMLSRAVFAAVDHGPRTLARFVHVEQPETTSQEDSLRFIRDAHDFMAHGGDERPQVFVLDCGGNNTALPAAVAANPGFVGDLEAAGVAAVLGYYWVPRVGDLTLLEQHADIGLVSPHTMLVMNLAKSGRGLESFEVMRAQEPWRRRVLAGAAELVLPALAEEWSQEVENLGLPFWAARDGMMSQGTGADPLSADPLSVAGRVAVGEWMAKWRQARAPVRSWLT